MNTSKNFRIMKERGQLLEKKDFSAAVFIGLAKKKRDDYLVINRNDLIVYFFNSLPDFAIKTIPDSLDDTKDTVDKKYHPVLEKLIFDEYIQDDAKIVAASILCSWLVFDSANSSDTDEVKNNKELNRIKGAKLILEISKLKIELPKELQGNDAFFKIIKDFVFPDKNSDFIFADVVKTSAARSIRQLAYQKHPVAFAELGELFFDGDWIVMNYLEGFKWLILAKLYLPPDDKILIGEKIEKLRVKYGSDCFHKGMDEAAKQYDKWHKPTMPLTPPPALPPT